MTASLTESHPVKFDVHGTGPTIVFLHGVGSGRAGWRHQIKPVVDAGWRFLAVDAPGFGGSALPDEPGFDPHVMSVVQVLDSLDISNAVICGHSLGGMTAQEIYSAHPERVSGLVLSATSPAFGKRDGDFQREFLRARFEPFEQGMTMAEFAANFGAKLIGAEPDDGALEEIIEDMTAVPVETYKRSMHTITGFDQRANLGNISVPTLLIAGETDSNSPARMMEKMAGKIPHSDYVMMPATGHMGPAESRALFNQHLTGFLHRMASR